MYLIVDDSGNRVVAGTSQQLTIGNALDGAVIYATSRTAIKDKNPALSPVIFLTEAGMQGMIFWLGGDYSEQAASDPTEAVYLSSNIFPPSLGIWARTINEGLSAALFGLSEKNSAAQNAEALTAAFNFAWQNTGGMSLPAGDFWSDEVEIFITKFDGCLRLTGAGDGATKLRFNGSDGISITGVPAPWWFMETTRPGTSISCDGVTFVQHAMNLCAKGTAFKFNGQNVEGRPAPPGRISNCTFRSDNGQSSWKTGICLISASSFTMENCFWAGCLSSNANGAIFIDLSASVGKDASPFHIRGCEGYYYSKAVNAGSYIEGVHVSDCDFVGGDHGIFWSAAASGGESQLSLHNTHIKTYKRAVYLHYVLDTQITGCLLWTSDDGAIGVEVCDGSTITISGNVVSCAGKDATNGIFFSSQTWAPAQYANKASFIGNNVINYCTTGVALGVNVRNVTGENAYASNGTNVNDVSGMNSVH